LLLEACCRPPTPCRVPSRDFPLDNTGSGLLLPGGQHPGKKPRSAAGRRCGDLRGGSRVRGSPVPVQTSRPLCRGPRLISFLAATALCMALLSRTGGLARLASPNDSHLNGRPCSRCGIHLSVPSHTCVERSSYHTSCPASITGQGVIQTLVSLARRIDHVTAHFHDHHTCGSGGFRRLWDGQSGFGFQALGPFLVGGSQGRGSGHCQPIWAFALLLPNFARVLHDVAAVLLPKVN